MFYKKWWAKAVAVALVVVVTGANYGCVSTAAPKSTVVTTIVASSTSVTAPAGLRVETGEGAEWGVHSVKWYYDGEGNLTREECYGADGQLTLDSYGVAIYEMEYDGAGNQTRQECYGVDGRLVADSDGVAIYEYEYDSAGNEVAFRAYDAQGRRVE